jgi:nucleoside phosphorylase
MRLTKPPFYCDANDPSSRKERLETVLSVWLFPRLVHAAERGIPPQGTSLSAEELALWLAILRVATPVPPRHHVEGLRIWARPQGLSIGDLERDGVVLIVGDQVAVRGQLPVLGYHGSRWSLLVPARIDGQDTQAILEKRFQNVQAHGGDVIAWGTWGTRETCTDSIAPLVFDALSAPPDELARLWKISLALDLEYRFLSALPDAPARALANLLAKELEAAAEQLTLERDLRLLRFALGAADAAPTIPPLPLPASRFAQLLAVENFFEHARHQFSDWYYDSVARALARLTADPFALGNVLLKLEPCSALISALDAIWLDRQELIAIYAWHPAYHAEGAFLLLQLQQQTVFGYQSKPIDFSEEWLEAQQLGRELLFLNDRPLDWDSLVALGIHDESGAIRRRHSPMAGIDRGKAQYEGAALWARAVADEGRAQHYIEALEKHFQARAPHSDAAFVFSLRLLHPLRESGQAALATRLATAIVEGYAAMLALDAGPLAIPTVLSAYGELLASLRESLDAGGAAWRRFLQPFDSADYLQRALDEQSNTSRSSSGPSFVVPQILRAHAEVLVALALAVHDGFEEPLLAALALYDADRKAGLHVAAFTWMSLARVTGFARPVGEPVFVGIGRLFGRVAGKPRWLQTFISAESEPYVLASIAAGLDASHPLAKAIRPKLRGLVNALLAPEQAAAFGYTLELAHLFEQAGIPRDSERLARRALQILEQLPQGVRDTYRPVAWAQLAGALAQQQLWPEVLPFEPQGDLVVVSPQARFIENMRALALMEAGRHGEAEAVLHHVLAADPGNTVALVNMTALHLRAGHPEKAIEACDRAKPVLLGKDRDLVLANEREARQQLEARPPLHPPPQKSRRRARPRAPKALARERVPAAPSQDVAPETGGEAEPSSDRKLAEKPVRVAAPADEGIDIAIITALPEEHEAVMALLHSVRDPPQVESPFPNRFVWKLGKIRNHDGTGTFKVVLGQAQRSGNMDTLIAAMRTIDRWSPRFLLFSGIAGGLSREGLKQGDIVLSESIWFYEYGKHTRKYRPRHRNFTPDLGLLNSARGFARNTHEWKACNANAPAKDHVPKCLAGLIGSGDKVLDNLKPAFVRQVLSARPEIQAVEMEAAGAGAAIQNACEEGRAIGFMMIRGISDIPKDGANASGSGTQERDDWKPYASAIAAQFIVSWISSSAWPYPPRSAA